ncbi:hypothetical protein REPUB_Repub18cG0024700 [Reevesia pubescens]
MPLVATPSQPILKLSKLLKEARQLGCVAFSGTTDSLAAKNWLKKVTDTLVDLSLKNGVKLKVATRLLEEDATT